MKPTLKQLVTSARKSGVRVSISLQPKGEGEWIAGKMPLKRICLAWSERRKILYGPVALQNKTDLKRYCWDTEASHYLLIPRAPYFK